MLCNKHPWTSWARDSKLFVTPCVSGRLSLAGLLVCLRTCCSGLSSAGVSCLCFPVSPPHPGQIGQPCHIIPWVMADMQDGEPSCRGSFQPLVTHPGYNVSLGKKVTEPNPNSRLVSAPWLTEGGGQQWLFWAGNLHFHRRALVLPP